MSDLPNGFTKYLDVPDCRGLQFQFESIAGTCPKQFAVTVLDQGKRVCYFNMCLRGNAWKIINAPKVNDAFLLLEKELASLIEAFEAQDKLQN